MTGGMTKKKGKYHNKKTEVDGILFDSKAEARYYQELKLRKLAGDVKSFTCQPRYELLPGFSKGGNKIRPMAYIADFEIIHNDGSLEVIDVKGKETEAFKLKRKLFDFTYRDLKLTIVKAR